jgi:putative ABC transport system ATP-binding protein
MSDAILQCKGLSKTYVQGEIKVQALKKVDLTLKKGAFAALIGPSGSGKSTLLNICGLIDKPTSGEVWFLDEALHKCSENCLTQLRREKMGFIFQGFNLVPVMSIYENVEYPLTLTDMSASERKTTVEAMLERVGIAQYAHHLPDQISGGQKQRVAIARALVKRPALVIADEPTANLDTDTATAAIDLMHGMCQEFNTTFIIATHDDRMSSRCDRQIILHDGEIEA